MAVQLQVSQVIDRPVADVFRFCAHEHVRNHPRWDPDMQLEQVTEGPIGVGTIIRRRNSHSGTPVEGTMEVIEFEPERAMGTLIREGRGETRGRMTFKAAGQGQTEITISAEFPDMPEPMAKTIVGLMGRSARNIKQLVESEV